MKYITIISILLIFASCGYGQYPKYSIDDWGRVYDANRKCYKHIKSVSTLFTLPPKHDTEWVYEQPIKPKVDTSFIYYKQYLHFRNLMNETTGRKSARYLDSTEKYFKLLYANKK